jgi:hypothetical protein
VTVANKSIEIPEILEALKSGQTTVSKLRKVCSVITRDDQAQWIALAINCTSREIEKTVAMTNPASQVAERMIYKAESLIELTVGISEELMHKIQRVQDLLATKSGQSATMSESIEYVVNQTLERLDPLKRAARATERAERQKNKSHTNRTVKLKSEEIDSIEVRKKAKSPGEYSQQSSAEHDMDVSAVCDSDWDEDINTNTGAGTRNFASQQSCVPGRTGFINTQRARLKADVVHEISLRDKSQCTHFNSDGSRCRNRRWLHFHHIKEVANGGTNEIENLTTICSGHHRMLHSH